MKRVRVILQLDYDPDELPGDTDQEKVENLIIPWSLFVGEMEELGCEVKLAVNGKNMLSEILGERDPQ